jgi:hypothetical protein
MDCPIIATMTTLPNRIDLIKPVLESILPQVHHVEINLPKICKRTNTAYVIPEWLKTMPKVELFECEDEGPITKILPTLKRHTNAYIFSIDDDTEYYPTIVQHCLSESKQNRVVGCSGLRFYSGGYAQVSHGRAETLEGFAGILYPPFDYNKFEYFDEVLKDKNCFLGDDVVISNYVCMLGMELWRTDKPMPKQFKFGLDDSQALHKQNNMGKRYEEIIKFLSRKKLLSIPVYHLSCKIDSRVRQRRH